MSFKNVVLTGLSFEEGVLNTSGIQEEAWFIPKSYFVDLTGEKVPVAEPATPQAAIEIVGNHVLKAGKAPIRIETAYDKSGMDSTSAGEKFSPVWMATPKFFQPLPTSANAANIAIVHGMRGVVLIKRAGGGSFYQIGGVGIYGTVKTGAKVSFGDGPTGAPGVEFQFEAASVMPFYEYKGELPAPAAP